MTNKHITTDSRPHFLPGFYSWLAENFNKVHVTVLTDHPNFVGPAGLPLVEQLLPVANLEDCSRPFGYMFKTVTLNLGTAAIGKFLADAEGFEVMMRFNSAVTTVYIPFEAVHSIYVPDNESITPFNFILRPGQENYSINVLKNGTVAVANGPTDRENSYADDVKVKPAVRPSYLKLVK